MNSSLDSTIVSRRSFLVMSGGAVAAHAVPTAALDQPFVIRRDGAKVNVISSGGTWAVDSEMFGDSANILVEREDSEVLIALRNAYFPGTRLAADFRCRIARQGEIWRQQLSFACGLDVESDLLPWLAAKTLAEGQWPSGVITPCPGLRLGVRQVLTATFSPDWTVSLAGDMKASVEGLPHVLSTDACIIALNHVDRIAGDIQGHRTTFSIYRGTSSWPIDIARTSDQGWHLEHDSDGELFDEVRVEMMQADGRIIQSALLRQSQDNSASMRLFPGGGLRADSGEPFQLSLHRPRLAYALGETPAAQSFIAEVSQAPSWAHAADVSFLLAATSEAPHFELHDGGTSSPPQVSPGLCEICFPNDEACLTLKLGVPKPFRFTWADLAAPFEQVMAWLHLLPSQHAHFAICFDCNDCICIDRPRDLLSLKFKFDNMRLITGAFPRIVPVHGAGEPKVIVILPPQHRAEKAFFRSTPPAGAKDMDAPPLNMDVPIGKVELAEFGDPNLKLNGLKQILDPDYGNPDNHVPPTSGEPYTDPVTTSTAGDTQLIFELPHPGYEIGCDIESLLRWEDWLPRVAPVARSDVHATPSNIPPINPPNDDYTSIELPYHLHLSPSELGRWAHSLTPVESKKTRIVELWHTRLAVLGHLKTPNAKGRSTFIDETNSKGRTVRAIWADEFKPIVNLSCNGGYRQLPEHFDPKHLTSADPYRTSLDSRDRVELVHLTSDYGITQQLYYCQGGAPVPPAAHPEWLLRPAPVQINRMMLTALGGYLDALGQWNPCKIDQNNQLTVQLWQHIATLGRDQYVKVVYKGFLAPFGLPASLVKITQREFDWVAGKGYLATMHQHLYIIVKNERKRCPATGHPFAGRGFPFSYIQPVTLRTPYLNDPTCQPWPTAGHSNQSQSLFWPMVANGAGACPTATVFQFRLSFTDVTGVHQAEASMPLVFVASDVAQTDGFGCKTEEFLAQDAVVLYNAGSGTQNGLGDDPWLAPNFAGQRISYAKTKTPGNTDFDTESIAWRMLGLTAPITGIVQIQPTPSPAAGVDVTFVEQCSKWSATATTDSTGAFTLAVPSGGNYQLSVTTHRPPKPDIVASSNAVLSVTGNQGYTLPLLLTKDSANVVGTPTLQPHPTSGISPTQLYRYDLPYFYPTLDYARITSTSIKRITGNVDSKKFTFFPTYLTSGFDPKINSGELFLQKHPDDQLNLAFGGSNQNVDKAGGLANPDTSVVGFSRKRGAVGGRMANTTSGAQGLVVTSASTFSSGKFDPPDFFGGLLSAKILGAVKLSDIIAGLASGVASNLDKAPQMVEQAAQDIQVAKKYTDPVVLAIQGFQSFSPGLNPLAERLSNQAQQVFATASAYDASTDAIEQALIEAELVANIVSYASSLEIALQDPTSLIEDEILDVFAELVGNIVQTYAAPLESALSQIGSAFSATLDQALGDASAALTTLQKTLAKTIFPDALTNLKSVALTTLAPDLATICKLIDVARGVSARVQQLSNTISAAATNPPTLQRVPEIIGDINDLTSGIQQLYEQAGYLGTVVSATKIANSEVEKAILTALGPPPAGGGLLPFWVSIDFSQAAGDLAQLQDDCIKLASDYGNDRAAAQLILQSLRQLQRAVQKATAYRGATLSNGADAYRQLLLLQKMQAHILRALADLQNLATQLPGGASTQVQVAATSVTATVVKLAGSLTVAESLLGTVASNSIEQQLTALTTNAELKKLLAAPSARALNQLSDLRSQIAIAQKSGAPLSLGLLLTHYNLSVDYQRPLLSALAYLNYLRGLADSALQEALDALGGLLVPIETLAQALQSAFCNSLKTVWAYFKTTLLQVAGPNDTTSDPTPVLGAIITSLFGEDLDRISRAFDNLCDSNQATPSEFLANGRLLVTAFSSFEADVRATINSLPALGEAALEVLKKEAQQLLTLLLTDIPIPTSIKLSYSWTPDIQSFEPVFVLGDNATFNVIATAEAGLGTDVSKLTTSYDIQAVLTDFSINLIGEPAFITLVIDSLTFTSRNGAKPDCRLKLNRVQFSQALEFIAELASTLDPDEGPYIELADESIRAGFRFAVPALTMGVFNLMQLAIDVAVALPFDGDPVRCEFGLSDQQQPFLLAYTIFGGGGFVQLHLGLDGVQLLQGAFEMGVCAAISIGPLQGTGFCVVGIYARVTKNDSEVCGFVHAHGHMDIFGIISMDVDLYVGVCYQGGMVQGDATFSVSISIGFFSESFSLTAHYQFQGGSGQNQQLTQSATEFTPLVLAQVSGPPVCQRAKPTTPASFVTQALWSEYYNSFV